MIQKNIGEMIAILIKSKDITQTDLAEKIGVPHSQINPFLRGHKDVYASSLVAVLKEVGIDVEAQLKEKLKIENQLDTIQLNEPKDAVDFLFSQMDQLNRETTICQMLTSVKLQDGASIDSSIENRIKQQVVLI